jgi:hypothetical protein
MRFSAFLTLLATLLLLATAAVAAEVSLTPAGDGKFTVNGALMDGVAGIELSISYDSSRLSGPTVTQGGLVAGAMMAANTNNPGLIRVAIINTKPFSGSGQIIALTFSGNAGSGGITGFTGNVIDLKGTPLQAKVYVTPDTQAGSSGSISNPFSGFTQENTAQNQQTTTTAKTATATAVAPSIGSLTLPDEGKQADPAKKAEPVAKEYGQQEQYQPPPAPVSRAEESGATAKAKGAEKKRDEIKKISYPSVLDRFKSFKGERQLAALAELFTRPVADEVRQEPAVAVSDGNRSVRILAGFAAQDDDPAPNFAATDARILSLKTEESGRWLIDLIPAKDTLTATVSILLGSRLYEVPLVILPPVKALTFSEKEVAAFLKDAAAAKPAFDLDGDGKHDYRDDYLYAGHYLLNRKVPPAPKAN